MSRVVLVGMGVPGFVASRRHAGPGLRAAHFATAIAGNGHDVLLIAVLDDGEAMPAGGADQTIEVGEIGARSHSPGETGPLPDFVRVHFTNQRELFSSSVRRRIDAFAPDAAVGVTVYAAALAVRLSLGVPLWADVFGDIMAEAQAKAARSGSDWSIVHFWTLLRGVLEEADRFSAVSDAQSHALLGQLGLAGRLSLRTAGEELVCTIPCAAEPPATVPEREPARRELGFGREEFVVLASGGVNTWCDVATLCAGMAAALEAEPRLRLVVTGGSIPGHDEASHAELLAGLRAIDRSLTTPPAGPHAVQGTHGAPARRVTVLGWIDSERMPRVYAAADLALHIERPLYERRLGAENRVVEWLAHGLPFVTTALSETGAALVSAGIARACNAGDAASLARAVVAASQEAAELAEAGRRGQQWVSGERGYARTAAPLLEWCASPVAARDRDGARLLRLGLMSHPETSIEMLEAYVAALPAREIARRGLRWIARRAWTGVRSGLRRARTGGRNVARAALQRHARFRASGRRW